MFDRYDSTKGRYVRYDYEPKGDRFERGLSETPRVSDFAYHRNTGNTYRRRKRTDELPSLSIQNILKQFPHRAKQDFLEQGLYVRFDHKRECFDLSLEPPDPGPPFRFPLLHLGFELTEQHRGQRLWFVCPYCERRVGKLFVYALSFWHRWGCQSCLGLSYPSQYAHKSRARDWAIIRGEVKVGEAELDRVIERNNKRLGRMMRLLEPSLERLER